MEEEPQDLRRSPGAADLTSRFVPQAPCPVPTPITDHLLLLPPNQPSSLLSSQFHKTVQHQFPRSDFLFGIWSISLLSQNPRFLLFEGRQIQKNLMWSIMTRQLTCAIAVSEDLEHKPEAPQNQYSPTEL